MYTYVYVHWKHIARSTNCPTTRPGALQVAHLTLKSCRVNVQIYWPVCQAIRQQMICYVWPIRYHLPTCIHTHTHTHKLYIQFLSSGSFWKDTLAIYLLIRFNIV